ncbi:MAG TPA: hypothetical protein VFQ65_06735, partial [Kofleriaceae bacterium]|nr:hypothetical protein [Kofleriaceae bacterium]
MAELAHPLIAPLPRLVPPAGRLLRWTALQRLRATWRGPRLELVLPSGELFGLGGGRTAAARATIHDDRF